MILVLCACAMHCSILLVPVPVPVPVPVWCTCIVVVCVCVFVEYMSCKLCRVFHLAGTLGSYFTRTESIVASRLPCPVRSVRSRREAEPTDVRSWIVHVLLGSMRDIHPCAWPCHLRAGATRPGHGPGHGRGRPVRATGERISLSASRRAASGLNKAVGTEGSATGPDGHGGPPGRVAGFLSGTSPWQVMVPPSSLEATNSTFAPTELHFGRGRAAGSGLSGASRFANPAAAHLP